MDSIVFTSANLLDGTNPSRPDSTVVVRGKQIAVVTTGDVETGPDDQLIDLAGRTLMPGMFTGHVHIDTGPSEPYHYMNIYSRAERPPGVLMARAIKNCQALIDSGITSYVGAGCSADIDAQLRIAGADGLCDVPRITASGHHLNSTGHSQEMAKWWYGMSYHPFDLFLSGAEEFRKATREEIQRGVDIVKVALTSGHGTIDRGRGMTHDELLAVVEAAHDRGKKVRAHCVWRDSIIECIEAGVDAIDHGDGADEQCIELMADRGVTWLPSMKFLTFLKALPEGAMPEMPRGDLDGDWEKYCRMLPLANEAGVNIVPGDDYGGGPMPHRAGIYGEELALYVNQVGIKPLDVIRWATYNGAQLSGQPVGEIREGLLADMVVVDGDPSTDIRLLERPECIKAVMIDGRFVRNHLAVPASR